MKRLLARLTGGRPMDLIGFAFTDIINGLPVNYYQDAFGRRWMAQGAWALFRVDLAEPTGDATPNPSVGQRPSVGGHAWYCYLNTHDPDDSNPSCSCRHSNGDTK